MRYALVYQCGIANVFQVTGDLPELPAFAGKPDRHRRRVVQHAYSYCEIFCRGLIEGGHTVSAYHCDTVGDIISAEWHDGPGELFGESKRPPK